MEESRLENDKKKKKKSHWLKKLQIGATHLPRMEFHLIYGLYSNYSVASHTVPFLAFLRKNWALLQLTKL